MITGETEQNKKMKVHRRMWNGYVVCEDFGGTSSRHTQELKRSDDWNEVTCKKCLKYRAGLSD